MIDIPITVVTIPGPVGVDLKVGINPNTNSSDKVNAFVNCFLSGARTANTVCLGLPIKLILAQWGGESGWATGQNQYSNQDWANMAYINSSNPPGNIGSGALGFAKFYGLITFSGGYGNFFQKNVNPRYSDLIDYLVWCQVNGSTPSEYTCAQLIANDGYGGSDHTGYYNDLVSWMNTVHNYTGL
jgi:hypothetical protein